MHYGDFSDCLKPIPFIKITNVKKINLVFVLCSLLFGCQNYSYDGPGQDVPTAGSIEIYVDQCDSLLVTEWIELFQMNYPKARIKPIFASHRQIMKWLEVDSLKKAFIINQKLTKFQKEHLAQYRNCTVHETQLAQTSLVFITNKQSKAPELTILDIQNHFSNKSKSLPHFDELVCDTSGIQIDQLISMTERKTNVSFKLNAIKLVHLKTDQEIIHYVQKKSNALGLISLNNIGNNYNKIALENQGKVRILKVQTDDQLPQYPFQSQIKAKQYPYIQDIVAYDLQGYSGLANGFITFVNSQPGQIICKKNGLIPSNDVGRTIEIDSK